MTVGTPAASPSSASDAPARRRGRTPSQPASLQFHGSSVEGVPILRLVWTVINAVKDRGHCTVEEIQNVTGIDVLGNAELMAQLRQSPKLTIYQNTFSYQPTFTINNELDVFHKVDSVTTGILASEIEDSYKDAPAAIRKLAEQGKIYVVENGDRKWLFGNRTDYHGIKLDARFREEWSKMNFKIPSEDEITAFLSKESAAASSSSASSSSSSSQEPADKRARHS